MTVYRFTDVTIDADTREIRRGGSPIEVQPQVFDVLLHLVEHRNRVVTKEELLDHVWKHRFVTESAITSRIKSARQAIGDNGRDQRMIKTMHGRGYRFVLELDEEPVEEPVEEAVAEIGEAAAGEAPRTAVVRLPAQPTPFVGREFELGLITRILHDPTTRLVTVLGPGGMGKTRLAIAAAERSAGSFTDGVCFVPLAPLTSAARVPESMADALGVTLDARRDPLEQLGTHLARRSMLLVLDNAEHLLPLDALSTLLDRASGLRVLVTSRERVGLRAERVLELGGMGWSSAGTGRDGGGAVDLFVRAARSAKSDLDLDDAALDAVRRICRMVGGMPLAIELAAGWSDVLSVESIAVEIERGLEFLETDLRDVPERHRSIQAVCDSSWERLSDTERDVFMRLSVFRGGCSRADAARVAGATLPVLRRLVATSMLSTTSDDRFAVHELLRQYGEHALAEAGLLDDARRRHSEHFLGRVSERTRDLKGERQGDAVAELAADLDNIRVAWSHATADGRFDAIEDAIEGLWLLFDARGNVGAMAAPVEEALAAVDAASRPLLLAARGIAVAERGELDEARATLEVAGAQLEARSDESGTRAASSVALVRLWLGWVEFLRGRYDVARSHGDFAMTLFDSVGDRWGVSRCRFLLGNVETALGRLVAAAPLLEACRAAADEMGDVRSASLARRNLAILAGWIGDFERARALLDDVLASSGATGDRLGHAYALRERGKIELAEGCADQAVATLRESIAITDELENGWESAVTEDDLANALAELGELDAAEASLLRCLHAATETANGYYVARCTGDLGALAARRGEVVEAERRLEEASAMWEQLGHEPYRTWVVLQLARVAASGTGGAARAADLYGAALDSAMQQGLAPFALEAVVGVAELAADESDAARISALREVIAHPAATASVRRRATALLGRLGADAVGSVPEVGTDWRDLAAACRASGSSAG